MSLHRSRMLAALIGLTLLLGGAAAVCPSASARDDYHRERHPELEAALQKLEGAKQDLQRGAHDFGGKRAEALRDVDRAIAEIREALQRDRR